MVIMGDLNLDFSKWGVPKAAHSKMVELVKLEIETLGFNQQVTGNTWSLNGQPEGLLDHVWMNHPEKLIYINNNFRAFSDHNMIQLAIRTKGKSEQPQEFIKRDRRNFNTDRYKKKISEIDWREFYNTQDLELKNSIFEEEVLNILSFEAPLKKHQTKTNIRKWVTQEMRDLMSERDQMRQTAKYSSRVEDQVN